MSHSSFRRLLPVLLCLGSMVAPADALAGSDVYRSAPVYAGHAAPNYYGGERGRRQNLHLYLNAPGNTVRILDGGKQIVVYDRECRVHHEVVPSRRGPHSITVTRC
jgi:hypothetical protein